MTKCTRAPSSAAASDEPGGAGCSKPIVLREEGTCSRDASLGIDGRTGALSGSVAGALVTCTTPPTSRGDCDLIESSLEESRIE